MTEAKYQKKIWDEHVKDGWIAIRLRDAPTSIAQTGTPDLLFIRPHSLGLHQVKFVEVKSSKGKLSTIQTYHIKKLNELGIKAEVKYAEC